MNVLLKFPGEQSWIFVHFTDGANDSNFANIFDMIRSRNQ